MSHPSAGLPDIQKTKDLRNVALYQVGVCGVRLPVRLKRREGSSFTLCSTAEFELSCMVPAEVKGTHMSRFTEVLNQFVGAEMEFSGQQLRALLDKLSEVLESPVVHVRMVADYFINQPAPVSGRHGIAPLKVVLEGERDLGIGENDSEMLPVYSYVTGIDIEGKTCCPCSREISEYDPATGKGKGAHAQRGRSQIRVFHSPFQAPSFLWFEDLVEIAWQAYSSPVYSVLKRVDEKHVTEVAYGNPKFVEDVSRDLIVGLRELGGQLDEVSGFQVRVENAESIHYHNAYAVTREARNPLHGVCDGVELWGSSFGAIYPF